MVQPESRISTAIMKAVRKRGGFCFKVHGSETMMAGLPDIVVCYKGLFVGMEVKTAVGRLSTRQVYVHERIRRDGSEGITAVPRSVADALTVLDCIDIWLADVEGVTGDLRDTIDLALNKSHPGVKRVARSVKRK